MDVLIELFRFIYLFEEDTLNVININVYFVTIHRTSLSDIVYSTVYTQSKHLMNQLKSNSIEETSK